MERRVAALRNAGTEAAGGGAESKQATARWVGKDALRELTSPAVTARLKP
jgi:hypothetical protein